MSNKITQKIREILSPEDLNIFETSMKRLINDRVVTIVKEQVELKEKSLEEKYSKLSEEFCEHEIKQQLTSKVANINEKYDKKLDFLEKKIVSRLDSFLETVINEQISEDLFEKVAYNKTLTPLVNNIMDAFSKHYIKLDTSGEKTIKNLTEQNEKLTVELNNTVNKLMEYDKKLERAGFLVLISEKTANLSDSQKKQVLETFSKVPFDEVERKIDNFIELIKENKEHKIRKIPKKVMVVENNTNMIPRKVVAKSDDDVCLLNLANNFI